MTHQPEEVRLIPPVGKNDRVRGPADAPILLVEYGDYDCPYAVRACSVVNDLRERLGDRMRFVYRAYPLTELHDHAQATAEAAAAQGKFWEMHDKLFEADRKLEGEDLRRYAEEAGLDLPRFEKETAEHTYAGRVSESMASARASEVQETPTFFINGVRHDGSDDLETLLAAMEGESGEASGQRPR